MNTASKALHKGTARLTLLALAASLGCAAGAANAGGWHAPSAPSVSVRYDDLNLDTVTGARTLYSRILAAAQVVCGSPDIGNFPAFVAARNCQKEAVARAVHEVHNEKLSAIYLPPFSRG